MTVGGAPATGVNIVSTSRIDVTTPPGTVGAQPVVVRNLDGQTSTGTWSFTYEPGLRVTGVNPSIGPLTGSRTIDLSGTGFQNGASATVGGVSGTVQFISSTSIRVTIPGSTAGAKDIRVTNPDTQYFLMPGAYTYASPTATTEAAGSIAATSAALNGTVNAQGTSTTVSFCYGTTNTVNGSGALTSCTVGAASPSPVTGTTGTAVSLSPSLTARTTYYYQVRATNGVDPMVYGNVAQVTTLGVPAAPATLSATPGSGKIDLAWASVTDLGGSSLTGYTVQRTVATSSACGASWTTIGTTPSATAYPDTLGTTFSTNYYCYQVAATTALGVGAYSSSAGPTRPVTAPSAPIMGTVTPGISTLTVEFTVPSSDGDSTILDYAYSLNGGASWTTQATTGSAPNLTMTIGGLTNGTPYSVLVRARNAVGNGAASGAGTGTPACGTSDAPTGLKGVFYDRRMHVSWTAPADTGGCAIDRYQVQFSTNNGTSWTDWTSNTSGTTYRNGSDLPNNATTNYLVRVRARNTAGNWSSYTQIGPVGSCLDNELRYGGSCIALNYRSAATASAGTLLTTGNIIGSGRTYQSFETLLEPTGGGVGVVGSSGRRITYDAPNAVGWAVVYFTYSGSGGGDGVLVITVQ